MKVCEYKKYCGGCTYQGMPYEEQLKLKQDKISNLFKNYKVLDILGCLNPYNYRNKVQVSFDIGPNNKVVAGNYVVSSHQLVPIDNCMISNAKAMEIINSITKLINKYKISVFDERSLKGCMRHVLIRCTNTNEYMVVLVTGSFTIFKKDLFIKDILKYNPEVTTIVQSINNKHTSMVLGDNNIVLYGKGYIIDNLCDLNFRISASSFYQVNSFQTKVLYEEALKLADLNKNDIVIDAYCGTGTIGLTASKHVKRVIGVEIKEAAIKDAIKNKEINSIKNIDFICADAGKFMERLSQNKEKIDVVIMDPPRSGSDNKFMSSLVKLRPRKVIYISCNPYTLKDNLAYLSKYYNVKNIRPVDMFPFTEHVENIALLVRK